MHRFFALLLTALLVATAWPMSVRAAAQPTPSTDAERPAAVEISFPERRWDNDIIRIGNDVTVGADDAARQVTTIFGNATIAGRVTGDVVVVFGHTEIASTALLDGGLVVVGGSATVAEGARIRQDLVVVGGRFEGPPSVVPGGDFFVLGPQVLGSRFSGLFEWLASGLMWGRLIVPSLGWVWLVVAIFFFVYLVLGLLFEKPVREITDTLTARPFTTFVVGFLITLLLGPVSLLLAASVVGIPVIPLVFVGLTLAWLLGKVGTARWIGRSVLGVNDDPRVDAVRAFAVGFAIVCVAYLVPVLGIVVWTLLSVLAVGASTLAFIAAYRRENPVFERARRVAPVVVAAAPLATARTLTPAVALPGGEGTFADMPMAPIEPDAFASGLLTYPKASFRDRLLSGVLDLILLMLVFGFLDPMVSDDWWFALALSYFVGFWSWKGTTIGGIICQLRIVRVDNQPLRFVDGLVRGLSGIFSLVVIGVGFLWMLRDPERQTWHDRIAGTYVVKVPRNYPL